MTHKFRTCAEHNSRFTLGQNTLKRAKRAPKLPAFFVYERQGCLHQELTKIYSSASKNIQIKVTSTIIRVPYQECGHRGETVDGIEE